jgi:hypothetical protein
MLIKYYKLIENSRTDLIIKGDRTTRVTFKSKYLSEDVDTQKTKTALRANITHFCDAFVLREIAKILGIPYITVHDSIGVEILKIYQFESAAITVFTYLHNLKFLKGSSKGINIKSNCIFI